jgi:hypothetical protein
MASKTNSKTPSTIIKRFKVRLIIGTPKCKRYVMRLQDYKRSSKMQEEHMTNYLNGMVSETLQSEKPL